VFSYQGNKKKVHISPEIRNSGGATFLKDIRNAEAILNCIGALICPDQVLLGSEAIHKLKQGEAIYTWNDNILLWNSFFSGIQVIANRITPPHRDKQSADPDYDFLVSAGTHDEAWLELEDVNAKLSYKPGTVVAICGKALRHAVPEWKGGERLCIAHFTRDNVHERLGIPRPNWVRNRGYLKMMDGGFLARQKWL
jgi:hypothetical protein